MCHDKRSVNKVGRVIKPVNCMSRELRRSKHHTFTLCSKNELESHRSELKSMSNICLVHRHFRSVSGLRTKDRPADTGETL